MIWKRLLLMMVTLCCCVAIAWANDAKPHSDRLSFDFQKIAVRDLLAILAKSAHMNFIISDKVQGEMSLHLDQVTWHQALKAILASQNLGTEQQGNILLIAPVTDIAAHQKDNFTLQQQQQQDEPIATQVIPLHFAKAQEVASMLKAKENNLLSSQGNVGFDARTNSIWIEDNVEQLKRVASLLAKLDVATPQVEIAARIVTLDTHYEKELGLRFGVTGGHLSGSLAGANALRRGQDAADVPLKERLNFDFTDMASSGASGNLGVALMKLADGYMLDMELAALQAEGAGDIIASPSLMTANQQSAMIQTGEDIPYQEKTSSGATSVAFKKAVLSLNVTPQITAGQKILLKLKINQDKPSSQLVNGVPAINTREIETQVLVNDGQTIVLGGIYEESKNHQVERVPFLSDIPFIGKIFQHQYDSLQKRELLIFVRPKIVV